MFLKGQNMFYISILSQLLLSGEFLYVSIFFLLLFVDDVD